MVRTLEFRAVFLIAVFSAPLSAPVVAAPQSQQYSFSLASLPLFRPHSDVLLEGRNFFDAPSDDKAQAATAGASSHWFSRGIQRGLRDQREIYSAPFHRSAVKWDLMFLAGTGALIAADKHISGGISRDDLDVSRNISNVGLYGTAAALGGVWTSSLWTKDEHAREAGWLGLEAFANTFAVYSIVQVAAGRERPLEGRGTGRFWQNNTLSSSFPSGHSAFTWSLASVLAHEYPKPWVEWLAYGVATTVSVTRVTGLKHFSADVAVGAVFGYLIGRHIFHAHCRPSLSPACKEAASTGD
jgi:membrane-associated phospholipid phosphatase